MTIFLNPEVRSGLGEDTFWTWFEREFPDATFDLGAAGLPRDGDRLLQYSTLGPPLQQWHRPCQWRYQSVALLFELHHEMRLQLASDEWRDVIARCESCADVCHRRVVSTKFAVPFYERFGPVDLLPIAVDCELFHPLPDDSRNTIRALYDIPPGRVGFWMGTNHRMKGADRLLDYARENPETHFIVVWKSKRERGQLPPNATEFIHVPQADLADLVGCSDFLLATGRLRPWFMVEWEAMASGLPVVDLSGLEREFTPSSNPREQVLELGWDRTAARQKWLDYLGNL